jgi:hypothetical protein
MLYISFLFLEGRRQGDGELVTTPHLNPLPQGARKREKERENP